MTDEISFSDYTLIDLLDAFASNDPVPGGGAATAVAGALGVSLLIMAAGLPKTRTMAPEEAADLAEAASRLRPLRDNLVELIDRDAQAYRQVMAALKLPKATDAEQGARRDAIQAGMKTATDTPLEIMRECQQALAGAVVVARNGYRIAASDIGAGVELLAAALRGCAMSIDGNLGAIKDGHYTARVKIERDELEADGEADAARARGLLQAP